MLLDCTVHDIIRMIGHDGSLILWHDLPEPLKRKSFQIEELQYVAYVFGYYLVGYVPIFGYRPIKADDSDYMETYDYVTLMNEIMDYHNGILLGKHVDGKSNHAVAWSHERQTIYDPNGTLYSRDKFKPETFYAFVRRAT